MSGQVATALIEIRASAAQVWAALTDPKIIKQYMFGSDVETSWQPGSPITWNGEYEGQPYQDKGEIVTVTPNERLTVTHYSPMSGQPDEPASYHTLDYRLAERDGSTRVTLTQDGNHSADEAERAQANWATMLEALKKVVE